ncbi:hypothetical protein [Streptomyces virginiae]|uniref:hypothetical protein n=1 Tax=Streptomyces virginiae TaxID=1961 RepID=UPI002DBB98F4|nr:hypothetical protein [Streptomyces sp. CMAA1738]MEC4576262.1 hypothetical protein [Streptomyces sp. CMAA1738]
MDNEQTGTAGESLTREELEQLNTLLGRFCTYDLDQFELIRTQAPYGEAYIVISNKPIADTVPEQYHTI